MTYRKHSDAAIDLVRRLRPQGASWKAIADELTRQEGESFTWQMVRRIWRSHAKGRVIDPRAEYAGNVAEIIQQNKKRPEDLSVSEMLKGYTEAQKFREQFSIAQSIARVQIKTDRPIALVPITDVHLGSPYTAYDAVDRDLGLIRSHPHTLMLKGGDWCDKFMSGFRDAEAPAKQLQPATIQLLTVKKILREFADKIVAVNGGNHDQMDARKTGISTETLIHYDGDFPYLPEGGLVVLMVGEIEYNILWKHNYRGNSQINVFNAHRWLRMLNRNADIAILEHTHNPGIEATEKGSDSLGDARTEINIRTGSYKRNDAFSERYFKTGVIGPETVVLYPDRRKIVPFHGLDAIKDAQIYMAGVNGQA